MFSPGFSQTADGDYYLDSSALASFPDVGKTIFKNYLNLEELASFLYMHLPELEVSNIMDQITIQIDMALDEAFEMQHLEDTTEILAYTFMETIGNIITQNLPNSLSTYWIRYLGDGTTQQWVFRKIFFRTSAANEAIYAKLNALTTLREITPIPLTGINPTAKYMTFPNYLDSLSRLLAGQSWDLEIFTSEQNFRNTFRVLANSFGVADADKFAAAMLLNTQSIALLDAISSIWGVSGNRFAEALVNSHQQGIYSKNLLLTTRYSDLPWVDLSLNQKLLDLLFQYGDEFKVKTPLTPRIILDVNGRVISDVHGNRLPREIFRMRQMKTEKIEINVNSHIYEIHQIANPRELKAHISHIPQVLDPLTNKLIYSVNSQSQVFVVGEEFTTGYKNPTGMARTFGSYALRTRAYHDYNPLYRWVEGKKYKRSLEDIPYKMVYADGLFVHTYIDPATGQHIISGSQATETIDKIGIQNAGYIFQKSPDQHLILKGGGCPVSLVRNIDEQLWILQMANEEKIPLAKRQYQLFGEIITPAMIMGINAPCWTDLQWMQMGALWQRTDLTLDDISLVHYTYPEKMKNLHRIVDQNWAQLQEMKFVLDFKQGMGRLTESIFPADKTRAIAAMREIMLLNCIVTDPNHLELPGWIEPTVTLTYQSVPIKYEKDGSPKIDPNKAYEENFHRVDIILDHQQYWYNMHHTTDENININLPPDASHLTPGENFMHTTLQEFIRRWQNLGVKLSFDH